MAFFKNLVVKAKDKKDDAIHTGSSSFGKSQEEKMGREPSTLFTGLSIHSTQAPPAQSYGVVRKELEDLVLTDVRIDDVAGDQCRSTSCTSSFSFIEETGVMPAFTEEQHEAPLMDHQSAFSFVGSDSAGCQLKAEHETRELPSPGLMSSSSPHDAEGSLSWTSQGGRVVCVSDVGKDGNAFCSEKLLATDQEECHHESLTDVVGTDCKSGTPRKQGDPSRKKIKKKARRPGSAAQTSMSTAGDYAQPLRLSSNVDDVPAKLRTDEAGELLAQPVTEEMQFVTEGVQPVTLGVQPVTEELQLVTEGMQPVAEGVQPVTLGVQLATEGMQPVAEGMQLGNEVYRRISNEEEASTSTVVSVTRVPDSSDVDVVSPMGIVLRGAGETSKEDQADTDFPSQTSPMLENQSVECLETQMNPCKDESEWPCVENRDKMHMGLLSGSCILAQVEERNHDPSALRELGTVNNSALVCQATSVNGDVMEASKQRAMCENSNYLQGESAFALKGDQDNSLENTNESKLFLIEVLDSKLAEEDAQMQQDLKVLRMKMREVIASWEQAVLSKDSVGTRLQDLRTQQKAAIDSEDYEVAAELDTQIQLLSHAEMNFKYSHPVFDEEVLKFVDELKKLREAHHNCKQSLLDECQAALQSWQDRLSRQCSIGTDRSFLDGYDQLVLVLKEDRLKLDRALSHVMLDKDHLEKRTELMNADMGRKVALQGRERDLLVAKRETVREEIRELEARLSTLKSRECDLSSQIDAIQNRVDSIAREYESASREVHVEREALCVKEDELIVQMQELLQRESDLAAERQLKDDELERNQQAVEILKQRITALSQAREKLSVEVLDIDAIANTSELFRTANEEVTSLSHLHQQLQGQIEQATQQMIDDQSLCASLKRTVSDVEWQISEIDKAKKLAVSERKFKDAKELSERIKTLLTEGEATQARIETLQNCIARTAENLNVLKNRHAVCESDLQQLERAHDQKIISSLWPVTVALRDFLARNDDCWLADLLRSELTQCQYICRALSERYGFLPSSEGVCSSDATDATDAINATDAFVD